MFPCCLLAGVVAGLADLGAAILYWWVIDGVPPLRIPQSIAAWVLGREAFAGGMATAVAGTVLFVVLTWGLVRLYASLATAWPSLRRHSVRSGLMYGALAYVAVFHIAVPLFAVEGAAPARLDGIGFGLFACAVLVGLPCAWAARRLRA
ncbi:hypothetical protein FB548_3314 [Pseudoxanthomonas sp. 3HH-4]|nr:hypothetical protein FB548_3314 [Pseudoxanthomonas sp. 3HH-4]